MTPSRTTRISTEDTGGAEGPHPFRGRASVTYLEGCAGGEDPVGTENQHVRLAPDQGYTFRSVLLGRLRLLLDSRVVTPESNSTEPKIRRDHRIIIRESRASALSYPVTPSFFPTRICFNSLALPFSPPLFLLLCVLYTLSLTLYTESQRYSYFSFLCCPRTVLYRIFYLYNV